MNKTMTQNEFNEWVNVMISDFSKKTPLKPATVIERMNKCLFMYFYSTLDGKYTVTHSKRKIIIIDVVTGKKAVAKCHPKDTFDVKTGIAIAWARYNGQEVPTVKEMIELSMVSVGTKFNYDGYNLQKIGALDDDSVVVYDLGIEEFYTLSPHTIIEY